TKNNRNYSFKVQNQTVFKPDILPTQASSTKNNTYRYNFQNRIGNNKEEINREEYQTDASSLLNYTLVKLNAIDKFIKFLKNETRHINVDFLHQYENIRDLRQDIDIKYCDSSVQNYEVENADESVNENTDESENYITYEEKIYTTDKFIKFLKKDTHYIDDDFSHQFENICEDIHALQRDIKDVKYGRDHNIYGGVHCIDG
ncbi:11788_t:CDS:2, partial [Racocetra fulgida]